LVVSRQLDFAHGLLVSTDSRRRFFQLWKNRQLTSAAWIFFYALFDYLLHIPFPPGLLFLGGLIAHCVDNAASEALILKRPIVLTLWRFLWNKRLPSMA
jgi:hypothetical protein